MRRDKYQKYHEQLVEGEWVDLQCCNSDLRYKVLESIRKHRDVEIKTTCGLCAKIKLHSK